MWRGYGSNIIQGVGGGGGGGGVGVAIWLFWHN